MDLANILKEELETFTNEASVRELIRENLRNTISSAIQKELRSYSDVGKVVEAAVKESLSVKTIDLPLYSNFVKEVVSQEYGKLLQEEGRESLLETFGDLFKAVPKKIAFDDLQNEIIELCRDNAREYGYDQVRVEMDLRDDNQVITLEIDDGLEKTKVSLYDWKRAGDDAGYHIGYLREREVVLSKTVKYEASTYWSDLCRRLYQYYLKGTLFHGDPDVLDTHQYCYE